MNADADDTLWRTYEEEAAALLETAEGRQRELLLALQAPGRALRAAPAL